MTWIDTTYSILNAVYVVTVISLVVFVIAENRNPVKTLAWVLVLIFLPIAGLLLYYLFGEDNRRKRFISKQIYRRVKERAVANPAIEADEDVPTEYRQLSHLLRQVDNSPVLLGNEVQLFTHAQEKFAALEEDIRRAKHHIHIQYYIVEKGELGNRIANLLASKAKQGVEVRFIYDDVGSWKTPSSFFKPMELAGVQVAPFLEVRFPLFTNRVNYRNHRKVVVIDGTVGYVGGMNIADRYLNGGGYGNWTDLHARITGRGVYGLQSAFLLDWFYARQAYFSTEQYFPPMPAVGKNPMQIVTSGPIGVHRSIAMGLLRAVASAKQSIRIQTPYFIPSESVLNALQVAALSGVNVQIIIPRVQDTWVASKASRSFVKELINSNIKVYFYENGFAHTKLVIIDEMLTILGSANMDVRSFEHNFEINAFIYGKETTERAIEIFDNDLRHSSPIDVARWDNRGRWTRFKESACRLLAPLL